MRWVLIAALVLSACGGGSGRSTPSEADESDDQGYSAETGAPGAQPAGPAAQGSSAVDDLVKKRKAGTFKVVYQWSVTDGSAPVKETWYSKPPKSRVDFGDPSQGEGLSQFILEDGFFICETSRGKTACWKGQGTAGAAEELSFSATILIGYESILVDPTFNATRESRSIAGQQASCFKSGSLLMLGLAEVTLCYAANGVPLLFEWKTAQGTVTMTATSFTTSVVDADFVLPAKPETP